MPCALKLQAVAADRDLSVETLAMTRPPTTLSPPRWRLAFVLAAAALVAGCDLLGIETASVTAARKEAEGKAIGAGCRHAARSVEQCYLNNKRAEKAAVFAGWKEMNDYMRENKIEAVPPPPPPPGDPAVSQAEDGGAADKADGKGADKQR
jgi:hypothetical protein